MNWDAYAKQCAQELINCYTKDSIERKFNTIKAKLRLEHPPANFWSKVEVAYASLPKPRMVHDSINATASFDLHDYASQILNQLISA